MSLNKFVYEEHPFAQYVRILGKGKRGSRSLTEQEAFDAMKMMLTGEAEPMQIGAFLMLLRVKEETTEELTGFVKAAKAVINAPESISVDIDWSSYAGKRRHLPWFLFSIFLLADQGTRVFIHGAKGHTSNRLYTETVLQELGYSPANSWKEAESQLDNQHFCYMSLDAFLPKMEEMIQLRAILGLRSPVHSLSRLLNPANAQTVLQGIFHPPYAGLHQTTGAAMPYTHLAVIKGEGGEIEINPDNDAIIKGVNNGTLYETNFPSQFARRHVKAEDLSLEHMLAVWRGEKEDEYAVGAVTSTLAFALHTQTPTDNISDALTKAKALWETRNKSKL